MKIFKNKKVKSEISYRGENIYKKLKRKLEPVYKGKFILIDVETGEYIIGDDKMEIALEARKKYPKKVFLLKKIGYSASGFLRKEKNG